MSSFQLRHGAALDWLCQLGDQSVDRLLTSLCRAASQSQLRCHNGRSRQNTWYQLFPSQSISGVFAQLYRVLKPDTLGIILCEQGDLPSLIPMAQAAGFKIGPTRVWQQTNKPARLLILLQLYKGKPVPSWRQQPQLHSLPADKTQAVPDELVTELLQDLDAGLVIDPFMQDHSIALGALRRGLRFSGAHRDSHQLAPIRQHLLEHTNATELMRQLPPSPTPQHGQLALLP